MATLTADELLDSSRFPDIFRQYDAIAESSDQVFEEIRKKISPELKEQLSSLGRQFVYTDKQVRAWDYQRSSLGYQFHILNPCHFCKLPGGGTKAYEIMLNGKWEPICHCCDLAIKWNETVPKPNCKCLFHCKE